MAERAEQQRGRVQRLRAEAERAGQLALRAPALVHLAEYAIRFLLGAVLAGAEIFGGYAPFGLALVGCSGSGLDGFSALLGTALGYLSFQGLEGGLRYVAAAILIFSVSFAFFDIRLYQRVWFMPLVAGAMSAATGFVYLSGQGWSFPTVVFFLTELLLTAAGVYFFRLAFSPWTDPRDEGGLSTRQLVSLFILLGAVLVSLAQLTLLGGGLSVGRTLAALTVMVLASQGGLGVGAAAGVAVGLAMDLAAGGPGLGTVAYGFAGLLAGAFHCRRRVTVASAYVLANGVTVLWARTAGVQVDLLYEVFAASVLFLLLPQRLLGRLQALLDRSAISDTREQCAAYVRDKLSRTAEAFRALSDSLRTAFQAPAANDGDAAVLFDRAADRVCRRCALRDSCWQRDYQRTFNALNDALPAMLDRGRGEPGDFPEHFSHRCLHFPQFLSAANEELTALLCRRQYQVRLRESRWAVCRQYGQLAALLSGAAAELAAELTPDPARESRLRQHLAALGLEAQVWAYYDEHGHFRCQVQGPRLSPLLEEGESEVLSKLLGLPLRPPELTQTDGGLERLTLSQAEPLMAVLGVAARQKDGETVSGDAQAWFKTDDGILYVLLCDGMGAGPGAEAESSLAVRLLARFLKAGVEAEAALRTLNSALALRSEAEGGFTTVDLLQVDLFSGHSALYKLGAAPSYVKKGQSVSRVTGSALPAGLASDGQLAPDVTRLALAPGDTVVLISDGVSTGREDDWLREALAHFDSGSPKDLARTLVEAAGPQDDRTALILTLTHRT